ncbi:fimbrial assembly protein [Paraburkholderia sejongensis]|uniref:fimbrial assembly protein n=1 Tax=Paraburkholderia sejongensis TaxID=2886946 RepID=UPI002E771104|nr:fimbrial assembly protein [Paraburkholderia sp. MMS20-SJTR3]
MGGFNLLPYRQRNARLARRRCLRDWGVAAGVGAAAVLALAGWQSLAKARLEARRESIEQALTLLAAPLAEHTRLQRARDEQRANAARAAVVGVPLAQLRALLDALSYEPGDGVVLRQFRQREHETELLASSGSHLASAEWLKRLAAIRGVEGAQMRELRQPVARGGAATAQAPGALVEFDAKLTWSGPPAQGARPAGAAGTAVASPRGSRSAQSGGGR